ncbi:DUF5707 domain-containing protein [Streptomyces beijiangensis]|uniref:Calcium-binding protein n=1 Tax=Streptomyces beijiangensis TaxID=163361 RepID=A0A939F2Y2_9ACTN|nr:DUF5707 domain-containing protein [Streptomyces beijiangensis]MBO0510774.1 calcium-binding protein [Streptomyces beijiangensis]
MRIRTALAATTGALAIASLVAPAAQAAGSTPADIKVPTLQTPGPQMSAFASSTTGNKQVGDTNITNVVVNGGKNIVVGTAVKKTFSISFTAKDNKGIYSAMAFLWHGSSFTDKGINGAITPTADKATCKKVSSTTSNCKINMTADPKVDLYSNILAGSWKVYVGAAGNDNSIQIKTAYKTQLVQRGAKIDEANAGPEPVVKGQPVTVTGRLARANWDDLAYHGYTGQPVKLQFRAKTSKTYTTVKTLKTDATGRLKTSVKATVDGYWRWSFAGTSTTQDVTILGDFVDVK